jgi:hypothetical protein
MDGRNELGKATKEKHGEMPLYLAALNSMINNMNTMATQEKAFATTVNYMTHDTRHIQYMHTIPSDDMIP